MEERKDLQQYSGLSGKWVENVILHGSIIRKAWELHVSDRLQFVVQWWSALGSC